MTKTTEENVYSGRSLKKLYDSIVRSPKISDDKYSANYIVPWLPVTTPCKRQELMMSVRTGILLDFDMQQIGFYESLIQDLKKMEINFIGYTTHSHLTDKKKNLECFRVIIPFKSNINVERTDGFELKSDYELLQKMFKLKYPTVDDACLRFNGSYAPCVSEKMLDCYKSDLVFDKEDLDPFRKFGMLYLEVKREDSKRYESDLLKKAEREKRASKRSPTKFKDYMIKRSEERLKLLDFEVRGTGVVHDTLLKVVASLKHSDFSLDEVETIVLNNVPNDSKIQKEVKQMITERFFR